MIGSEHRQAFLDLTKRIFQGESSDLLFEMVGLHGRRLWLETHAVPLRDEKDEIVALLGVTRDVTERKRAEEALRSSETRFRSIIENASVGILVADIETGRFRYANPTICRLLGYEAGEFSTLAPTDLVIPEEQPESAVGFQAHVEGRLQATERTFRRKDGSTVRVSINSVPMEYDGRACVVGFFADITERQLLEEERLKAQKLESIGTLAGGIAHDFNNLLQGVFGFLSLARLSLDRREEVLAMLDQADKALHQSVNLTTQLLTFSKGGKPVRRVIDLRPVVENAVKFALSGSRVTYELSFGEDLRAVEADEGQIGQVVQNIVLNAARSRSRRATPRRRAPPSSPSPRAPVSWRSWCATWGSASPRRTCRGSSTPTSPPRRRGAGSVLLRPTLSSGITKARLRSSPSWGRGRPSPSCSRPRRRCPSSPRRPRCDLPAPLAGFS
jgi:PAS domain S-box-containing protein